MLLENAKHYLKQAGFRLIKEETDIYSDIIDVLLEYSSVYRSCVYERYREQLVACQIYSEEVMTQQLLKEANGAFVSKGKLFQKRWHTASTGRAWSPCWGMM